MKDMTTIAIQKSTKEKLDRLGRFGQSYDELIQVLIQKFRIDE